MQPSLHPSSASADYLLLHTAEGRVALRPGVRWDAYDAYLFDIDGTLLRDPGRVHYHAFSKACVEVMGFPLSLEQIQVQGSTDPRILREAFTAAGIAEDTWRPHQPALLKAISDSVERDAALMQIRVMPGVVAMIEQLSAAGRSIGVASGNLESIGWLKLDYAGLRERFHFGGFSDDYDQRAAMIAAAARAARAHAGAAATLMIIGDTPSDIEAARANHIPIIAVATGRSSFDTLLDHQPDICTQSLSALLLAEPRA